MMITEIYQQSDTKTGAQPPWQHRFLMFLAQHYSTKVPILMQDTGLQPSQINQVLNYFGENGHKYFQRPNLRPLSELQRQQQLTPHYSDITEEDDEDNYDEYDETRSTTRASASKSSIVHVDKPSLKRKIKAEGRGTPQKKRGDIITNF
eukprot:5462642-Amphidinium_carterae.1